VGRQGYSQSSRVHNWMKKPIVPNPCELYYDSYMSADGLHAILLLPLVLKRHANTPVDEHSALVNVSCISRSSVSMVSSRNPPGNINLRHLRVGDLLGLRRWWLPLKPGHLLWPLRWQVLESLLARAFLPPARLQLHCHFPSPHQGQQ
jgi:hypothetical protein